MANVSSSNGLEKRPKLRFPGFDEPWKPIHLSDVGEASSGFGFPDAYQGENTLEIPFFKVSDMNLPQNVRVMQQANNYVSQATVKELRVRPFFEDAIVFAKVGAAISHERKRIAHSPFLIDNNMMAFTPKQKEDLEFIYHLFQRIKLSKYSQIGALPSYNASDILDIRTFYPTSKSERNKIVTILNLVSNRIEKQAEMITNLKKYKRGVLFRIFGNNENASLRYSSWSKRTLAELCCEFKSGRNISASLIHSSGLFPVYGGNGIRGYCDQYSHEGEYVVVGRQGALCGNVRLIQGMNYLSEHAIAVKANEQNDTRFLLYLLDYMRLGQYSDQGAQPGLAVNKLLRLQCDVPDKNTQTHIAAFLFCIDKQIGSHQKLLDSMLKQRKALLQQLFI